jgi:hypothetical protein
MTPTNLPSGTVKLAQLNTGNGNFTTTFNLQGKSASGIDWRVYGLTASWSISLPRYTVLPPSTFNVAVTTSGSTAALSVTLPPSASSLYSMFGNAAAPMSFPPSTQMATGSNLGPPIVINVPGQGNINQDDSWLTIGDPVPAGNQLNSVGLSFSTWTSTSRLSTSNGAVILMTPTNLPSGTVKLAQLNTGNGNFTTTFNLQGKSASGIDWRVYGLTASWSI